MFFPFNHPVRCNSKKNAHCHKESEYEKYSFSDLTHFITQPFVFDQIEIAKLIIARAISRSNGGAL